MILNALDLKPLPIYGQGDNVRDWLYVDDHACALATVLKGGIPGETYNVGGSAERTNLQVVQALCTTLDTLRPRADGRPYDDLITFVSDRPGHDKRYAIDSSKIKHDLGWVPRMSFETGIRQTVQWYLDNEWWWGPIRAKTYSGERLGQG